MSSQCDPEVYNNGTHVFLTHTISSVLIEKWVNAIAQDCGQKVDWHWIGGRANVLSLGDPDKTRASIKKMRPFHDEEMKKKLQESSIPYSDGEIERYINGIWEYNGLV